MENEFIAIVNEAEPTKMKIEVFDKNKDIDKYIKCSTIDYSDDINYLTENNIDLWYDDEFLNKGKKPTFVVLNEKNELKWYIGGNIAFLKHDGQGKSYGLNFNEVANLRLWIEEHHIAGVINDRTGEKNEALIIRDYETYLSNSKHEDLDGRFGKYTA